MFMVRPLAPAVVLGMAVVLSACTPTSSVVVTRAPGSYTSSSNAPSPPPPPGGSYRVVKGDTLYSIAFRNKVDFRDLAGWNNIASPFTIWPGQDLRLSPPGHDGGKPAPARTTAPVVAALPPPAGHPAHGAPTPGTSGTPGNPVASSPTATSSPPNTPPPATAPAAMPPGPPVGAAAATAASSVPAPATTTNTPVVVAGKPAESVVPPPTAPAAAPAPVENPPAATPIVASGATRSAGGINWRWPADGTLIKRFASGDAIPGIEVAGKAGDPVRAAADGVVVYSGNGLVGYGELVIIKHSDSFLSAYGHNRKRLVKEGEKVKAGQSVAEMGSSGATRDELQFQIRRDGNPVDPLQYLPQR